jgi:hypothetical protein
VPREDHTDMTPTSAITAASVAERLVAQDLRVAPEQAEKLAVYLDVLAAWNRRVNLVGPSDWTVILDELVADSPHLAAFLDSPEVAGLLGSAGGEPLCLDFGAGAGLPGIPLRILWPRGDYVLIEVRAKRAAFLAEVLARLGLPRTTVFSGRAERAARACAIGPTWEWWCVCPGNFCLAEVLAFASGMSVPRPFVRRAGLDTERRRTIHGRAATPVLPPSRKGYRVRHVRYFYFLCRSCPKDPCRSTWWLSRRPFGQVHELFQIVQDDSLAFVVAVVEVEFHIPGADVGLDFFQIRRVQHGFSLWPAAGASMMVRGSAQDRGGPVDLFQKHHPGQFVGQGAGAEADGLVGPGQDPGGEPIGPAHHETRRAARILDPGPPAVGQGGRIVWSQAFQDAAALGRDARRRTAGPGVLDHHPERGDTSGDGLKVVVLGLSEEGGLGLPHENEADRFHAVFGSCVCIRMILLR